jgi:hypothetical protein
MIPDNVCIWCHSFWRNDLFQPLFQAVPGVILFGSMRNAQGTILYPRHVWKNDQLIEIPFTTGDLADLAQALSINDAGNIFGIGHIGSTLPFYTNAGSTTPIEVKGTVAGVTIGGIGSINSGKPGITSTGRCITDGVQQDTPAGSNPITGTFLWHINNNQLSYTKITDNLTHYADPGVYWRHAYPKTFLSTGGGSEVELDGQLNYLCETPSADTKIMLGDGHAYSQKTGEAWTEIKSIQETFNYIREFSRVGVGYKTPNSLWMNGKSYLIKNFAPDYDKHPVIEDLSNNGHLLFTLSGDEPSKCLAGFPFQLEDNEFATGVDTVSASTSPFEPAVNNGFQDRLWVMAPQGTWTSSSGVAQNNSNAFTIKTALDASTVNCTCGNAQFNGAATPLILTGKDNLVEISGAGTATTDDKFSMTMGSTAAVSFPIGVKSMKRRTVKVAVHPVVSNAGILSTYTGDPPMPTFFLNKTASGPQIDKVGMTQKVRSVLDQIYGKQINVYFNVVISDLKIKNYDTGDTTESATPDNFINPTSAEGTAMISDLENPNVDIQVFLLYDLLINGDIAGYTATMESPKPNCTWIMANPFRPQNADTISRTIAHEIGHVMIGPGHPDDQIDAVFGLPGKGGGKARLKGTDTTKRLMYSHVRTNLTDILLVKAEWDAAEEWLKMVPDKRYRDEHVIPEEQPLPNY